MAGIRRCQGKREKKKARPLSQSQIQEITSPAPETIDGEWEDIPSSLSNTEAKDLNWETAIKLGFEAFLQTAELIYEKKDLENSAVFEHTKLQRRDITFSDTDDVIVNLRSSKSDYDHTGVEVFHHLQTNGQNTLSRKNRRKTQTGKDEFNGGQV